MTFKEVEPLEFDYTVGACVEGHIVKIWAPCGGDVIAQFDAVWALRDWLNRVLDSYPARGGWKMVPVEPTEKQLGECFALFGLTPVRASEIYKAALAAAPTEQTADEKEGGK